MRSSFSIGINVRHFKLRHYPIALCLALSLPCAVAPHARATEPAGAGTSGQPTEAATRVKLGAVRAEIAKIAAAQRATAAQRQSINATLAQQAQQLDEAARALHDTDAAIAEKTDSLRQLQQQRAQLEKKLAGQREALAELLRAAYALDRGSDLSLLLGDADIARIDRALAYSRYFQHYRVQRIRALLGEVAKLDQVRASIDAETAALQKQRDERAAQAQALTDERDAQQKLLAQADAQLAEQKDKLVALKRDAQALDKLLQQLKNVFADIPEEIGKTQPFAQLRGKLPWPVTGAAHVGSGTLAHGLVIAARPGTEVRVVAYGRVAWADFMRGFGMLVIIDHGDGWMSLYGGNEAALVEAGDWVKPGQAIATVGRAREQGGAWFGIRKDGKPVDPRAWLATRK